MSDTLPVKLTVILTLLEGMAQRCAGGAHLQHGRLFPGPPHAHRQKPRHVGTRIAWDPSELAFAFSDTMVFRHLGAVDILLGLHHGINRPRIENSLEKCRGCSPEPHRCGRRHGACWDFAALAQRQVSGLRQKNPTLQPDEAARVEAGEVEAGTTQNALPLVRGWKAK